MLFFIKKILLPLSIFLCSLLIVMCFYKKVDKNTVDFTLKSYKNTIALYSGQEIVENYSEIVLNTLPEKDIQTFKKGITFSSPSQAEIYLQDFE